MSDKPQRNPATAHRNIADEGGLVVVPGASQVKVLNPVGSKIYSLLDGKHSREQIVDAIVEEFDVDAAQAGKDLDAFLDQLREQGLLAEARGETA